MNTLCIEYNNIKPLSFQALDNRKVEAKFDGGKITSDAGTLLLREIDKANNFLEDFSNCFTDYRDPRYTEHTVQELVSQRIYGICLGYEDVNDHDILRNDPLLAMICGKVDPEGEERKLERDKGKALAGKSTLNRLETAGKDAGSTERYKKVVYVEGAIEEYFVEVFLRTYGDEPEEIVIDVDASDDPLYGEQWPEVKVVIRGDSGFCHEGIMGWCEQNGVDYVFGIAKNKRLVKKIEKTLKKVKRKYLISKKPQRVFRNFTDRTLSSWSRKRRVVGKTEYLVKGENPRFIVTSLSKEEIEGKDLYEKFYCARGDMENRIKEQQLHLFADRTSSAAMRANQLRLWFSTVAYVIMHELRKRALQGTEFGRAQCETIRLKLLKI